MSEVEIVVVAGLGEIGGPLLDLVSRHHYAVGLDITPCKAKLEKVDVLHICYPFQGDEFINESTHYIKFFHPELTIIDSTVPVGTTRAIANSTGAAVAHSPVRGKHASMFNDLQRYVKFVGAVDGVTTKRAVEHLKSLGLKPQSLSSPEATEFAKLIETTYFGLLIAWAQDIERGCDKLGVNYDEVVAFYEEIGFFPPIKYFPGIIGGHCVMPNIELLRRSVDSELVEAIRSSNEKKIKREKRLRKSVGSSRPE